MYCKLLCTAALAAAFAAPAQADTIDVVAGGTIRSYEGTTLGVDQIGAIGTIQFAGESFRTAPAPRAFSSARTAPVGTWDIAISYAGDLLIAEDCRIAYLSMLGGNAHWRFACAHIAQLAGVRR